MKTKSLLLALFSAGLTLAAIQEEEDPAVTKVTYNNAAKSIFVTNCAPPCRRWRESK